MFITKFAKIYTPIVVILALILAFVPPIFVGFDNLNEWIRRALVFLVTSCPCALVLSVPLGFFAGIGKAGRRKSTCKRIKLFRHINKDKTGTITKGNFEVSQIITANNIKEEELLDVTAIAESMSNHPIAQSITNKAKLNVEAKKIQDYSEIAGCGIKAIYEGNEILVGNSKLMEDEKVEYLKCTQVGTVVYVAKDKKYLGAIVISDIIKEDSKEAIKEFKENGINNIFMLTGDNESIANNVAKVVGIENVFSNLLPADKVKAMEEIKKQYGSIVAIGDGINDSPLLALSDLGVSMGNNGADLAIETSDIVIMDGKLSSFNKLIKIAKRTKKIVKQNIYFAIGIKVLVLVLGALGISTMWEAVFADVGVTLITVLNALRILKK